ncbi:hypothetical protein LOTGIDRAFT_165243 [Lottia gigantea]|uniref:Uncharacterized protein n=1 Tax=Lottia gigantea TaxID=225164 RepID=V4BJ75_LOTGI|nr:hypothetical protein LOTGIDRAFT_165243 [Lottia gigantea]ESO88824.1 hypothetical protein LOTGIDRAFT_165243 [Lottia gigantea]
MLKLVLYFFSIFSFTDIVNNALSLPEHFGHSRFLSVNTLHPKNTNFTYFTFTQAWPTTVCLQGEEEHHKCNRVLNVTGWTIHGLWPSGGSSKEGPEECNKTAEFNSSAVAPLLKELQMYWPNLYIDTAANGFWEHEWFKHGTCAASVKQTANEYLYFLQGLTLYKEINLTNVMAEVGIVPDDDKQYDVYKILTSLKNKLNGIEPVISCFKSKRDGKFYLDQMEICYSKDFEMVDCTQQRTNTLTFRSLKDILKPETSDRHLQNCPKEGFVYYPTVHGTV